MYAGGGPEVQDLLERAVGVTQPAGVLAGVDPAHGALTGREYDAMARVACLLGRRRGRHLAGVRRGVQVALGICRGVEPLPQQRERLRTVEQIGLDAGGAQRGLDLRRDARALDRRVAMRRPRHPPSRARRERSQLFTRGLEPRQVGDRDPPAGGDGRLLGAGGGEHGLGRRLEQPPASVRERMTASGTIGVRGRPGELEIALERLSERNGIGLRVDDDPLVVGNRPADVGVGPLDRSRA